MRFFVGLFGRKQLQFERVGVIIAYENTKQTEIFMRKAIELTGIIVFFAAMLFAFVVLFVQQHNLSGEWEMASTDGEVIDADLRISFNTGIISGFDVGGEIEINKNGKSEIFTPVSVKKGEKAVEVELSGESGNIRVVFNPIYTEVIVYYDDADFYAGPGVCATDAERILNNFNV